MTLRIELPENALLHAVGGGAARLRAASSLPAGFLRPDLSSDRRALAPPGCHALEYTVPKDQRVHQRSAEMDEKSGEQQVCKRRVQWP
jgi:hypothetical protein